LPPTFPARRGGARFIDSISRDKTARLRGEIYTRISRDSEHDARMLPRRGTEIYIRIRAVLSFSLHILAAGTRARIVDRGSVKTALVGNKLVICEWTVINVRMSRRARTL